VETLGNAAARTKRRAAAPRGPRRGPAAPPAAARHRRRGAAPERLARMRARRCRNVSESGAWPRLAPPRAAPDA
jgi:hypothetical protein